MSVSVLWAKALLTFSVSNTSNRKMWAAADGIKWWQRGALLRMGGGLPWRPSQESFVFKQLDGDIICIHKPHPYKVYNSMVFNAFTELCNHHHNLILEHFHHH